MFLKLRYFLFVEQAINQIIKCCYISGKINNGLKIHPNRTHMIYAIGCNLIIENLQTRHQDFLIGHNNNVSCLTLSKTGNWIASGQMAFMGFKVMYFWCNMTYYKMLMVTLQRKLPLL